jgi:hypothetical protein
MDVINSRTLAYRAGVFARTIDLCSCGSLKVLESRTHPQYAKTAVRAVHPRGWRTYWLSDRLGCSRQLRGSLVSAFTLNGLFADAGNIYLHVLFADVIFELGLPGVSLMSGFCIS